MKSDIELQRDILDELELEPNIDSAEIGVMVDGGVVTLKGRVPSYAEKLTAERATQRIAGVKAVANEIEVVCGGAGVRDDDIARAAADALESSASVSADLIKLAVDKGWVTLDGEVGSQQESEAAQDVVGHLLGVRGVVNNLILRPHTTAAEVWSRIESAFLRNAEIAAKRVRVEMHGDKVKLLGVVRSWAERQEAERTAWAAPGVSKVVNKIAVAPYDTAYTTKA